MEILAIAGLSASSLEGIQAVDISSNLNIAERSNKIDFSNFISSSIDSLNSSVIESNKVIEDLALGKIESTHEVVIAMEKAKMSLQIAVEVRNKLVEAYKEVTRMQI